MTTKFLSAVFRPLARAVHRVTIRRLALTVLLTGAPLAVPCSTWAQSPPLAAAPAAAKSYIKTNVFTMPVSIDDRARGTLKEVQLFVKDHPSKSWILKESAPPTATSFTFRPPQDGEYWFTVVTVDKQNRATPADLNGPGLSVVVVVVDTKLPQVSLRPQPPVSTGQVVECVVLDENPDPNKTRLEYQIGTKEWRTAEGVPGFADAYLIPAEAKTTGLLRASATDRALNTTVQEVNVLTTTMPLTTQVAENQPGTATTPSQLPPQQVVKNSSPQPSIIPQGPASPTPVAAPQKLSTQVTNPVNAQPLDQNPVPTVPNNSTPGNNNGPPLMRQNPPNQGGISQSGYMQAVPVKPAPPATISGTPPSGRHLVNQTNVSLEYQVTEVGPSGIGKVEVYITSDQGQSWRKLCEDADCKSPVQLDLPGEGLFGITLVVSNGRGYGAVPPRSGDAPDWLVETDLTRPVVELTSVQPNVDAKSMIVQWKASDKNLGDGPVDLYFAVNREGPWTPIARGVKNDGHYHWNVPQVAPQAYVRVVVSDRAGNVCTCETTNPVVLDQSCPRAHVYNMAVSGSQGVPPTGN